VVSEDIQTVKTEAMRRMIKITAGNLTTMR
jgi:hypothetical protein